MPSASRGNLAAVSLADDETDVFAEMESEVRSYCRYFPATFKSAKGAHLVAEDGTTYIDFFCGASSLNYGHNNEQIKKHLLSYLQEDGLIHALDMYTTAKRDFLTRFRDVILEPRGLSYKVQFCGPTGADGVEAALKLARKVTGRTGVIAFSGAYHGMSMGALSATGSAASRRGAGTPLHGTLLPALRVGAVGELRLDRPAHQDAFRPVLWPRPAGGGYRRAGPDGGRHLPGLGTVAPQAPGDHQRVRRPAHPGRDPGRLRRGPARSSASSRPGIRPDLVTLSKSISGYGLPMSIVLMRPELDIWRPGEHAGTFRGNQLSFVAAATALDFWEDPAFLAHLDDFGAPAPGVRREHREVRSGDTDPRPGHGARHRPGGGRRSGPGRGGPAGVLRQRAYP